ncbi:hypothetical protein [uncultured Tateyamaria sp.]|uniref:hypothetical protein n=1 Tax=uncultured Tateyamaria sp. TaxID=455651 RepID=UPI0026117737|nr:hypothetical protein [uncultured Tateyamaria sp.]
MTAIDKALEEKGLSDAAASDLAVGHKQLLKNIRNPRGGKRMHPVESLARLFDVLDIEFNVRSLTERQAAPNWRGFAEDQLTIEGRTEALAEGYAPIPYLEEAGGTLNVSPVAVSRDWVTSAGLDLDALCVVQLHAPQVTEDLRENDRLIVDRRKDPEIDGRLFVFFNSIMGGAEVARLDRLNPTTIAAARAGERLQQLQPAARIIGPIVGLVRFDQW